MNITSRFKKWAEEATLIGAAVIVLAILEYDDFIRKRNERR